MVTLEAIGNCPNCGVPIRGDECQYCGTVFTRKSKGFDIYNTNGSYVLTLLENGIVTRNEARRLCGLPYQEFENVADLTRKLQFL